jgi:hypothetical protein
VVLTTQPFNPALDLPAYVGQRAATFRFDLVDAITGYREAVHPVADAAPTLTHNTRNTVKRTITGLELTREDTAKFNSISSRLEPFMIVRGVEYPLGRYVPASQLRQRWTTGVTSVAGFFDEGIIVDQQLDSSFGPTQPFTTEAVASMLTRLLTPLPIRFTIEPTIYTSAGAWAIGTRRGSVVGTLAEDGDYLSPWFDHRRVMRFIRTFDPGTAIVTFDLDETGRVLRDRIIESDDLTELPNRFMIIGNGASVAGVNTGPVVGSADVPSSAPHSILNRGFVITSTESRQLADSAQAAAIAKLRATYQVAVEQVELITAPDPRHDSYDVLRWRGVNWLEVAWTLPMKEGAAMQHIAQRAYTP